MFECDLHTHTTNSDGKDSYLDLIENAAARGIKVLAVTDHDVLPDTGFVRIAAEKGVELLPGIEFSCDTHVEDVHIVGLFCDFSHPGFSVQQRRMRQSKLNAFKELGKLLGIGWNEIVDECGGEDNIQKKRIFELMAKKGMTPTWREAKLLVQSDEKLNKIKREKISPDDAISLIRSSGGKAILAHPYLIDEQLRTAYVERLIGLGIDGMEASYPYSKTSYRGNLSDAQIERGVRRLYEKRLAFMSGGSDYHNDAKSGILNGRQLGECGVTLSYFDARIRLR